MNFKLRAFFLLLSTVLPLACLGQDVHFSQYNFSSLPLNPALTCAYKDLQVTLNYKDQWHSMNAFQTAQVSLEMKLNQKSWVKLNRMTEGYKKKLIKGLAFGINLFSDKAGDGNMKTNNAALSIAYHILLNEKNTLSAGIMGGLIQRSIDPTDLRWNNQYSGGMYDPNNSSGEAFSTRNFLLPDYSGGLLWSYGEAGRYMTANDQKFINLGISLSHINQPKYSFLDTPEKLHKKYTIHSNMIFGIKNSHYSIAPSFLYMIQGTQMEFTFGTMIKYKIKEESKYTGIIKGTMFSLGCFYRNRDALIPCLLLEMDKYTLGLSYDSNISSLTSATAGRGGFEICLRFGSPSPFLYQNVKSRI